MTGQNGKPQLFVVDGSNIATEGRSQPSLEQLTEAVAAFRDEYPGVNVTVVVDATFGHRIAKKEVKAFDKAVAANELVTPPAGAVGRGDAFILAIADKAKAGVFSNDSFQEFHGEYEWLFENGRLIGAKPVPNVGWVFVDRNPVRGRKSRESIKAAKVAGKENSSPTESKERAQRRVRKKQAATGSDEAAAQPGTADEPTEDARTSRSEKSGSSRSGSSRRRRGGRSKVAADAGTPDDGIGAGEATPSKSAAGAPRSGQVNDPAAFFDFVEHHQSGARVKAVVESYSSHGAYARVDDVLVYIPLRLMSDPAPTSARKMLKVGEEVDVVIVAYVPDRLSIDAALPAMAPTAADADQQAAEASAPADSPAQKRPARRRGRRGSKQAADEAASESTETPVKRAAAKKKAATKAAAKKAATKAAAKKASAKKAAAKKAPAKKASANKAAAKKAPANKGAAKKAPAKKAAVKKAPAKKAPAKKAPAKGRGTARKKQAARPTSQGDSA